jgi:peptidoglycan/xylan/chitin deacetylase (PgdA/CDA1 family)
MSPGAPVALAAGAAFTAAVAAGAWAVRGRSSAVFAPSVWRGPTTRKAIALTFDDGPSPSTPRLLDLLAGYAVPATFFQIGANTQAHPEIAVATADAGHELGNHSQTHPNFALTDPARAVDEFSQAQQNITSATGRTPVWLRAPYGVRWFGFREAQWQLGLTGVMWSVIGRDWTLPAPAVAARVLKHTTAGGIICLHDGRGTLKNPDVEATLEAVRRIVPELLEQGYRFETLSELLCPTN